MHRWGTRFDWEHLRNWVPGVLGASAAILLVVVAANSPTQNNSKPAESPPSQSAALPAKGQTVATPTSPQPTVPQTSSVTANAAKAAVQPAPAVAVTTGEAAKPAPMQHAAVMAQAEPVTQAQAKSVPEQGRQTVVAAVAAGLPGDPAAGRQVFKKCQACHALESGKTILGPSLAG